MREDQTIYVIASAQDDNIGDLVIRRALIDTLRGRGRMDVFVADASESFLEGLLCDSSMTISREFVPWSLRANRAVAQRKGFLFHTSGELLANKHEVKRHLALLPAIVFGRLHGTGPIRIGSGIRTTQSMWWRIERPLVRLDHISMWRDETSHHFFGNGETIPDLAFMGTKARQDYATPSLLSLSFRFDRPAPPGSWYSAVGQLCRDWNLEPVLVSQVKRDDLINTDIATKLGCEAVLWESSSHVAHERRVRNAYADSLLTMSNRLHGLIMALNEGSIPVGIATSPDSKIRRHFLAAGIDVSPLEVNSMNSGSIVVETERILQNRENILSLAQDARSALRRKLSFIDDALPLSGSVKSAN